MSQTDTGGIGVALGDEKMIAIDHMPHPVDTLPPPNIVQQPQDVGAFRAQCGMDGCQIPGRLRSMAVVRRPRAGVALFCFGEVGVRLGAAGEVHGGKGIRD